MRLGVHMLRAARPSPDLSPVPQAFLASPLVVELTVPLCSLFLPAQVLGVFWLESAGQRLPPMQRARACTSAQLHCTHSTVPAAAVLWSWLLCFTTTHQCRAAG